MHQRKRLNLFAILLAITVFCCFNLFLGACNGVTTSSNGKLIEYKSGFSVHFLDVGQGDCIFINFPDGKTMLIDTADKSEQNLNRIVNSLKAYNISSLDYLLLTHPDVDHIGNALEIIKRFSVKTAFLPNILSLEKFPKFKEIEDYLVQNTTTQIVRSYIGTNIVGQDYKVMFLTPNVDGQKDGAYSDLNSALIPTEQQINDVSPIVYLECLSVRFIFTGDAGEKQEKLVVSSYESNIYDIYSQNYTINLDSIDFLKLSHHGANDANCFEFLQLLKPKNAVISLAGDNIYGHPSSTVLTRLQQVNEDYNLYRTDVYGDISVFVDSLGNYQIKTQISYN